MRVCPSGRASASKSQALDRTFSALSDTTRHDIPRGKGRQDPGHLTVPLEEIENRLRSDVTTGRQDDLREAAGWVAASKGVGIEDLTVSNDRPIRQVALEILDWLRWK
jgi:hypothetical protein